MRGPSPWLETATGEVLELSGNCALGRSRRNDLVIDEQDVSRYHSLIHVQGDREYWLVDRGSRNGTFVNDRRLTRPIRLHHGDRIDIGSCRIQFKMPDNESRNATMHPTAAMTVVNSKSIECWLLVADVIESTRIIRELETTEISQMMGGWLSRCRDLIEGSGGFINKFLGDGFFAYWPDKGSDTGAIRQVLAKLGEQQEDATPPFRVVLHRGRSLIGGDFSPGADELIGADVSRVFRMEALAGSLKLQRLTSSAACEALGPEIMNFQPAGEHQLDGFPSKMRFYTW